MRGRECSRKGRRTEKECVSSDEETGLSKEGLEETRVRELRKSKVTI